MMRKAFNTANAVQSSDLLPSQEGNSCCHIMDHIGKILKAELVQEQFSKLFKKDTNSPGQIISEVQTGLDYVLPYPIFYIQKSIV